MADASDTDPAPPALLTLYARWAGCPPAVVESLPPAGSARRYWRLSAPGAATVMGTFNPSEQENRAFLCYARHFHARDCPVPEVYECDLVNGVYLQQDLGRESLLQCLQRLRREAAAADQSQEQQQPSTHTTPFPEHALALYKEALTALARLQIVSANGLDYDGVAFPRPAFDRRRILWDLNYFKYMLLKLCSVPFDEDALHDDIDRFVDFLLRADCDHFMFRDFQARNVMIHRGRPFFIDFQGGCRGALQYDVASILFQAKASLPAAVREQLFEHYVTAVEKHVPGLDRVAFKEIFHAYVLLRQLQTLGAYGFRGLFERRQHFIDSLPLQVRNVTWVLDNFHIPVHMPELARVLRSLHEAPAIQALLQLDANAPRSIGNSPVDSANAQRQQPNPAPGTTIKDKSEKHSDKPVLPGLTVNVVSFSYKKGLPHDTSGHGGGFVFDCRGLNNPGRHVPYKKLTGHDASVRDFLRTKSEASDFLQHAHAAVSVSLRTYIDRAFESLLVSFGCTGGQHRSVYCANETASWLRATFPADAVHVRVWHRELIPKMRLHCAMVLAAGLGTRLRPLTDDKPKALVQVHGVALLELQLRRLRRLGFDRVVVNVHHHADMVEAFLAENANFGLPELIVSDERDCLLETGGALLRARQFFNDECFYACNVDVLSDVDPHALAHAHTRRREMVGETLATVAVRQRDTARYLCFDDGLTLTGWTNVKTGEIKGSPRESDRRLAFSGLHVIDPRIFDVVQRTGAFSVIDMYVDLAPTGLVGALRHDETSWLDVGRAEHLQKAHELAESLLKSEEV